LYLEQSVLDKVKRLFTSLKGKYIVIENVRKENYETMDVITEEHLPNYLIVNNENGAIEFATDQLPSACQISGRLEEELASITGGPVAANQDRVMN
jgi:hypothetical protein